MFGPHGWVLSFSWFCIPSIKWWHHNGWLPGWHFGRLQRFLWRWCNKRRASTSTLSLGRGILAALCPCKLDRTTGAGRAGFWRREKGLPREMGGKTKRFFPFRFWWVWSLLNRDCNLQVQYIFSIQSHQPFGDGKYTLGLSGTSSTMTWLEEDHATLPFHPSALAEASGGKMSEIWIWSHSKNNSCNCLARLCKMIFGPFESCKILLSLFDCRMRL